MCAQLNNLYVSKSFQGLLKMTDSATGVTGTLQTVQTGDGTDTPLQISQTEVNISGSLTVNGQPITGSTIDTGSFATTGSNIFVGKQTITGSNGRLIYDGTTDATPNNALAEVHADNDSPWLERFYNDSFSDTNSVMSYFGWNDGRFIFHNDNTQSIAISVDGYYNDNLVVGSTNTTSNNDFIVSGSIKTDGAIVWGNSAFNYIDSPSGSLYFSALSGGTVHINDDGGEGDIKMLNGQGNKVTTYGDVEITGSLRVSSIKGTGSLFLQPNQSDARYLEVYNTSPTDTHITGSGGQIYIGDDVTYVKVDNYGSTKRIDVVANNGVFISGSVQVNGQQVINDPNGFTVNDTGNSNAYLSFGFYDGAPYTQANFQTTADNTFIQTQGKLIIGTGLNGGTGSISISAPNVSISSDGGLNITGQTLLSGSVYVGNIPGSSSSNEVVVYNTSTLQLERKTNASSSGTSGTSGQAGNNGSSGTSGQAGSSGTSGSSGQAGSSGTSGTSPIVDTGSYATTGSNTFNGNQIISGSLIGSTVNNGMIKILNNTFVSGAVKLNITGSNQDAQSNIVMGWGASLSNGYTPPATFTGSIILSGSNNILMQGVRNVGGTTGFRDGYVNGTYNIFGGAVPVISTSSLAPININANISFGTTQFDITTGSSLYNFSNNYTLATTLLRHKSGSFTMSTNQILGNVTSFATSSFIDSALNYAPNYTSNIFLGNTTTLLNVSSSIVLQRNLINATTTRVDNQFTNPTNYAANGSGSVTLSNNIIGGNTHTILSSGSALTDRTINNNLIIGYGNNLNQIASGSANTNLTNTAILGQGLIVSGSNTSTTTTGGSTFVGRWNATGSLQEGTAESIFVVGAGTSAAARSNALHIDSSSNIRMTGSVLISGSLALNGNIQFNVGAFSSTQNQSGSANVSQSITYDTTDYSQGVTYVSGSRLTVANKGVYNIQFSAQIDRVAGSGTDTVYIWLKKNGSNLAGSAGAITISGGAAAAKTISSWNYVVDSAANDYYELVWQPTDSNIQLISATATGNIPSIPSIITTVTQVR